MKNSILGDYCIICGQLKNDQEAFTCGHPHCDGEVIRFFNVLKPWNINNPEELDKHLGNLEKEKKNLEKENRELSGKCEDYEKTIKNFKKAIETLEDAIREMRIAEKRSAG